MNKQPLPIQAHKDQIIQKVTNNSVTVICGETGCGKTTQVPQYLLEKFHGNRSIVVSQPRRISAVTLASRVAQECGVQLGAQVGYCVRFEEKRSNSTRITFATDGMVIRELMVGRRYSIYVLDEAHERSVQTDVLLAVLKRMLVEGARIKLVIMSATIDASRFMRFFNSDALVKVSGRTYPIEIFNLFTTTDDYMETCYNTCLQIHDKQPTGDVLVFLTGEEEIVGLQERLTKAAKDSNVTNLEVLMLYSALPFDLQQRVFLRTNDSLRRFILATNIAQTSVTVPGVRYVVDCGYMKVRNYSAETSVDALQVRAVSKANALQRAGRAGRQFAGKCFRLYSKLSYEDLEAQPTPQILRSQLSGPFLQLKAIGVQQLRSLQFVDAPLPATIDKCFQLLESLNCLNRSEQISEWGRQVSQIPLAPIFGNLLLLSVQKGCEALMLTTVSLLACESILLPSHLNRGRSAMELLKKYLPTLSGSIVVDKQYRMSGILNRTNGTNGTNSMYHLSGAHNTHQPKSTTLLHSDHLAKLSIVHEFYNSTARHSFCKQNRLSEHNLKRVLQVREQLIGVLDTIKAKRSKEVFFNPNSNTYSNNPKNLYNPPASLSSPTISIWVQCLLCLPFIASLRLGSRYSLPWTTEQVFIHPQSVCFQMQPKPRKVVFSGLVRTNRLYMKEVTVIQ